MELKKLSIDSIGMSITQEPEDFEDMVERALDKGPGSWENDAWLPWALKEDLRLRCFKLGQEIVADKNEISKLDRKIVELKQGIKHKAREIDRMQNTLEGLK